MELLTKISWGLIAIIHLMPSLVLFKPDLTNKLYDISPAGDLGLLIIHRGALFLGIVVASIFAIFDQDSRRVISCVAAISIIGFLFTFWRGGMPEGALRTIALADLFALVPLLIVIYDAFK